MPRMSFRDPVTHRLKTHGYMTGNDPGDLAQVEADDFALDARDGWQWNGTTWERIPQSTLDAESVSRERQSAIALLDSPESTYKLLRAVFDVARDEINILRSMALLQPRTFDQLKQAIEDKIRSGGNIDQASAERSR